MTVGKQTGRSRGGNAESRDEGADLLGGVLLFDDWQGIDPAEALRREWDHDLEIIE